ncbi:hypothetical protein [Clostridium estertheticum]|uniref:hypothetical protein n=1 Tax=Clostridium estertheticum TaxID=238834 RepID=UPI0014797828|nr:hypothetical protein [Clostridium estertheticum]MBZ9618517.1 hypothetical protein [Clostridium estertheticum subsp. laramiense]
MLLIGFFMDLLMKNNLIPVFNNMLIRMIMMMFGMLVLGIASLIYLGVGLGSDPRDGLMIVLTKKQRNQSVLLEPLLKYLYL